MSASESSSPDDHTVTIQTAELHGNVTAIAAAKELYPVHRFDAVQLGRVDAYKKQAIQNVGIAKMRMAGVRGLQVSFPLTDGKRSRQGSVSDMGRTRASSFTTARYMCQAQEFDS